MKKRLRLILTRFLILILFGALHSSCTKLEIKRVGLVVVSPPVYDSNTQSFEVKGEIIDKGENDLVSYGHVWSLSDNPEISTDPFSDYAYNDDIQNFVSTINDLGGVQKYYIRSYIKDIQGEVYYSEEISFVTPFDLFLQFVFVEGGEFIMGAKSGDILANDDEKPRLKTEVSDFYIGKYEVTQAFWGELMPFIRGSNVGCNSCPITGVSWEDVQIFLVNLNNRTKDSYRLPTEAEWEFAASGGNLSNNYFYSGSNLADDVGWYEGISGTPGNISTQPVGQKKPNELGLYDMSGNVGEICSDWYDFDYYKDLSRPTLNPLGPEIGIQKSTRGGAFNDESQFLRVSNRIGNDLRFEGYTNIGFRLVREP